MIAPRTDREAPGMQSRRPAQLSAAGSEGARRELVRRIVHSPTFARSERLGTLLTYICDMAFKGREAEINEQKIGQAVFGRAQDYDSAVDGIVRSQASRLRQRLELYFQQEGADEPVRIVIPRGGYVPVFESQTAFSPSQSVGNPTASIPEICSSIVAPIPNIHPVDPFHRRWLPWGLSLRLGLMLLALWFHDHRQPSLPAAIQTHPFWSHLFTKNEPVLLVAPDSGLVLYHGMSGKEIDLKEYLEGGYRSESNGLPLTNPTAPKQDWLLDLANRRYTSIVDLNAILSLRDRARTLGSDVSVRYARDLRPNDFKKGTVVLLGAYTANPWVELFENNMNFVLKDDYTQYMWVLNRNPRKGEPARWVSNRSDPQRRVYGVVAYVPNLAGDSDALLLEGTGMSGTEAVADFLNDDARLLPFLNQIGRPDGTLPHFELLIEAHNMGASAVRSQIVSWRTVN